VYELGRTHLSGRRYEDVDLRSPGLGTADWSATQAVPTAGLDAGQHGIGPAQQQRRVHELIDCGAPGEQEHDPGQCALPRSAFKAALVRRSFRDAVSDEVAYRRDAAREGGVQAGCVSACPQVHPAIVRYLLT
jgi:hypothetical protein